jgi:hypothetical protein
MNVIFKTYLVSLRNRSTSHTGKFGYIDVNGFGGLVVSMLASGTRVRGFKPGRSRWIFLVSEKSSACLPSEGK